MARLRHFTNEYKLTARTVRAVYDRVTRMIRSFADEKRVLFRGRKLGAEAYLNVAAWYFADLPRERQEQILMSYLPRIEAYLIDDAEPGPSAGRIEAEPEVRDVTDRGEARDDGPPGTRRRGRRA